MPVLIVDDSRTYRHFIRTELEAQYEIVEAEDCAQALKVLQSTPIDLVTLDIEMPEIDGFEVCRRIRRLDALPDTAIANAHDVPIIFITGRDTIEGRLQGFESGCTDFLPKSFERGMLAQRIERILSPHSRFIGKTVLIAEDDKNARQILVHALAPLGMNLIQCEDGRDAFEKLCENPERFDLLITDCNMPLMNGIELCKKARHVLNIQTLPILFVCSEKDEARRIEIFQAGATAYIKKPFIHEEFIASISANLHRQILLRESGEQLSRLDAVLKNVGESIVTFDEKGLIQSFNSAAEASTGYDSISALGQPITLLIPPQYHQQIKPNLETYLASERFRSFAGVRREAACNRRDGSQFPILITVTSITHSKGTIFTSIFRDITAEKDAEEKLLAAKENAEAASIAKSRFLANMSHEIRTPMNGVLGMLHLLLETSLSDDQRELAKTAHSSAESLLQVINDILDFSKIEAGKLHIETIEMDLRKCTAQSLRICEPLSKEKSIELVFHVSESVPSTVLGDPLRIQQILVNLLSNALKFTPRKGGIIVIVDSEGFDDSKKIQTIHFSVSDTGIGIADNAINSIFEAFEQADGTHTRRFGGTGLGLTISAQLAKLMNGQIWVESIVNRGSTFHVSIPFQLPEATTTKTEKPEARQELTKPVEQLSPLRIVVAEDNRVNQKLVQRILEKAGHAVTLAENGKEMLEELAKQNFDVALVDIQMPVMNGEETIARIRADDRWRDLPVIAVTAHAMEGDRERYLNLGMNGYVSKPIAKETLFAEIRRVLKLA